jgi:hypothetical protein
MLLPVATAAPGSRAAAARTLHVATNGVDAGACLAQPCASLARAYQVAQAGDEVEIAAGDYPAQSIAPRSLSGPPVTFRPAVGAAVRIAALDLRASNVTLRGLTLTGGLTVVPPSSSDPSSAITNVTLNGVNLTWAFVYADSFTMRGGSVGGFDACNTANLEDGMEIWERNGVSTDHVTIDGVVFHDVTVVPGDGTCGGTPGAGRHVDCLQLLGGRDLIIRNSIFYNCATDDIIARPFDNAQLGPLTIENTMLAHVAYPGSTIDIGDSTPPHDPCTGPIVVRHNTMVLGGVNGGCSGTDVQIVGNILETGACDATFAYDANVFEPGYSTRCGKTSRYCRVQFATPDAPNADFHLAASDTCARAGGGAFSLGPASDIDGQARSRTWAEDAGADQKEPASIVPGKSIGAIVIGTPAAGLEALYGKPARTSGTKLPSGKAATVESFFVPGGRLSAIVDGGVVVGVGTTSPYYTTPTGLGVGAAPGSAGLPGLRWAPCGHQYRKRIGAVTVAAAPRAGRQKSRIASLTMVRGPATPDC